MPAISLPTGLGSVAKPKVKDDRHHDGDGQGAGEVAQKNQRPVPQHPAGGDAGPPVEQRQRRQHHHAGQQVVAEQIEHAEADGEQQGPDQRLAGGLGDGDGEGRGQGEQGARHIGANKGVLRRHEDLRLSGVDRLSHKLRRW